ncbi:MAG: dephospho-CoA kinase [Acidaminococcaceae bacterium]|jgi:dephospho-CoA kinase|nr:dephospho-CoA kinase [Acidaminococcaceae bacterium]
MISIGLTGGIASGKSTVSRYLQEKGIAVFDCDESAKKAVAKGSVCLAKIVKAFGDEILNPDGNMNRKAVSELVFGHPEKLGQLNSIVHNWVSQKCREFLSQKSSEKIVVLDMPLLIECEWYKNVDKVWLVKISPEEQIKRAMLRSQMTSEEVKRRIASQMSLKDKEAYADVILDNSGSVENLKKQVDAALLDIYR